MTTWNGIFFHSPASLMMEVSCLFHDYIMLFLLSILILVLCNIIYLLIFEYFNLNFFENHTLEMIWTVIPFLLLIFLIIPSLNSVYLFDSCLFCGLNVNIMGHQWYWSYFYKDFLCFLFDSYMTSLGEGCFIRLLETDNRLIVPCCFPLRFLVSSSDVIHSWTIPSFGLKFDAIPGRINQFCFNSKRSGVFFGQCSEICGVNHSFMPICLEVVPFNYFFL